MLDFVGTVVAASLIVFIVSSLLVFMEAERTTKMMLAGAVGLWVGLAAASSAAGWLTINRPFVVMGVYMAVPLIAAAVFAGTPTGRTALMSLPMPLLVGLNIGRIFAVMFLLLLMQGRLSGPFPYSAAIGDIVTGLLALRVMRLAEDKERNWLSIAAWNAFGILDLVVAIALGVMSGEGSPLQVFAAPGSAAMQHLPQSFVPTVLVPLYLIMHGIVWAQLRRRAKERAVSSRVRAPG